MSKLFIDDYFGTTRYLAHSVDPTHASRKPALIGQT
jgi:hypothetical protein